MALSLWHSGARAICLVPSDHVLNLHGTARKTHQYGDIPQQRAALADQFIERGDSSDDDHHYYFCSKCNHIIYPRKREYLPVISRVNKQALVHYTSGIKDTLGVSYVLNCHFLI